MFAILTASGPLLAHHSFVALYDVANPLTFTGVVSQVEWTNPHVFVYLAGDDAGSAPWQLELASPNALLRCGWGPKSVKAGDRLTVDGYRAKDGSHLAYVRRVMREGRTIYERPSGNFVLTDARFCSGGSPHRVVHQQHHDGAHHGDR